MGNGVMPNGLSYRAHPRLYRSSALVWSASNGMGRSGFMADPRRPPAPTRTSRQRLSWYSITPQIRAAQTSARPASSWWSGYPRIAGPLEASQPELAGWPLPADMLTTSASGLDPDISPADAAVQVVRVARARGISTAEINQLLQHHITDRSLGIFGEPRVNVLALNLALDEKCPKSVARLRLQDQAP
jgi:hypothetical protein